MNLRSASPQIGRVAVALLCVGTLLAVNSFTYAATPEAYKCALSSSQPTDPDWKSQAFPLVQDASGWEAAEGMGSSVFFDLTLIDPSQLTGWPTYPHGTYYSGNNDVYVIIKNGGSLQVVKPLETDPNTNQRPSFYHCTRVQ